MAIDQGLTEFFHANGYAVVGKVLEDAELAALRQAYDRIFRAEEKPGSYRNLSETQGGEDTGQAVLQIINMYELDEAFRQALFKENLLDYARAFVDSPAIRLYHDQALYKPARTGGVVPWHQDNAYWKLAPPQAASCWLALDDVTVENGCMWVIPGSHRTGKAAHGQAGKFTALLDTKADESKAVPVELPAGAAMFHHCQTLHSTYENRSPHQRRAWAIHYMPADTRQEDRPLTDRLLLCRE